MLDAKVHSPSGALEECHITEVTEGEGTPPGGTPDPPPPQKNLPPFP